MDGTRREFVRWFGVAAAAAFGPQPAWADRVRILGGPGSAEGPGLVLGQVSPEFQRFVGGVRVGESRTHGLLRVFWLHGPPAPGLGVATLEEARSRGDLAIVERDQATVPELIVENRGKGYVLLLAGEILLGGKQNRVLTEDILLPPFSGPRNIAVYCVEQGRWAAGGKKEFDAGGSFAAPGLRSKVLERADQGRIWAEVEKYARSAQAPSPTRSYQAIYDKAEVKEHLERAERGLDARAAAGALGAAVFTGGALAGLDLFFDPGLFAREWPKLLRAQALDVYNRGEASAADEAGARARVEELLRIAGKVEGSLRPSPGAGRLFEYRAAGQRGSALVYEARVIHAAIL